MENSALESGFCRGSANETGHSPCDKPSQTGATIAVGSTPTRTTIRATAGNVFIEPIVEKHSTILHTPETIRADMDIPHLGRVVAVGGKVKTKKGVYLEPEFKVGDKVAIRKFTAQFVTVDGKQLLQVKQHEVLAVVNDE